LDRVDSVLDGQYTYGGTGKGASVYIVDTGIQSNHAEFNGGRVSCGINLVAGEDCEDGNGHGTHVAGTVGGQTYGVAKGVNLVTVKALNKDGNGNTTGIIQGLEYVAAQKLAQPATPMIVHLSLGSGKSQALNEAVNRAVAAGLVVISAAGNESVDACTTSPASADKGITVGATDRVDNRPSWSNYGPCVDLHAYVRFV
jgi:aqualysin 1